MEQNQDVESCSANIMSSILNDFFDYSQIKAGKFSQNITKFDVVKCIKNVKKAHKRQAKEQNLMFTTKFNNIVKDPKTRMVGQFSPLIISDEERLQQVLLNLHMNAFRFTKRGFVSTEVEIVKRDMDHYL